MTRTLFWQTYFDDEFHLPMEAGEVISFETSEGKAILAYASALDLATSLGDGVAYIEVGKQELMQRLKNENANIAFNIGLKEEDFIGLDELQNMGKKLVEGDEFLEDSMPELMAFEIDNKLREVIEAFIINHDMPMLYIGKTHSNSYVFFLETLPIKTERSILSELRKLGQIHLGEDEFFIALLTEKQKTHIQTQSLPILCIKAPKSDIPVPILT